MKIDIYNHVTPMCYLDMLKQHSKDPGIANDGIAEMCRKWPEKFPAFVAALPMNNVQAALLEMDRAITGLGARGIQICTNVAGRRKIYLLNALRLLKFPLPA